jgi:iron-sulfur cluster repair protein YtfE (RIC family)
MPINAVDMRLVHRVFRREFAAIPGLIAAVPDGDSARAKVVGDHLTFMLDALHNHHASEDEMIWPLLHNRVPARADDIERMERQHSAIVGAVERASADVSVWVGSPGGPTTHQLLEAVAELGAVVVEHLDDEESIAVPIIQAHLSQDEWDAAVKRAAAFLTSHPRLAIVQGGLVLDYASADERQTFMSGVPLVPRLLLRFLSPRMTASYRRRLYAS